MSKVSNKSSLGKGLDALLSISKNTTNQSKETSSTEVRSIPVGKISQNPNQPRKNFDEQELDYLADSIKSHGILQPILLRSFGNQLELISGERRLRASIIAGLKTIPAITLNINEETSAAFALIENIQRKDLNVIEEAESIQKLIYKFNMSHDDVSKKIGRSRAAVTNTLRLLLIDERVKQLLLQEDIRMGHARALLALTPDVQYEIALKIRDEGLSVRETEKYIKIYSSGGKLPAKSFICDDILSFSENWSDNFYKNTQFKTKVCLQKNGKGSINIAFSNSDEMKLLMEKLKIEQEEIQ